MGSENGMKMANIALKTAVLGSKPKVFCYVGINFAFILLDCIDYIF